MKVSEQVAPTAQQSKPLQLCQLLLATCPILKITENCYYYYLTLYVYLSKKYISLP